MSSQSHLNVSSKAGSGSGSGQSLTFDDVSNYFSLPLSDAANHLGVCVSVLKRICRENGLDRWPYRKFLCGKSIEDIKKHAAREKSKELADQSKVARQGGFQPQNNEMSKVHGITSSPNLQQQGNKNISVGQSHIMLNASLTKSLMALDEFKYGFPLDGLSTATYKWWGSSSSNGCGGIRGEEAEVDEEKDQSEEKADDDDTSTIAGNEKSRNGNKENKIDPQGSALLTAVRKRIVEEGQDLLKLGICKSYGVKKLGRKERVLLHHIFKSSVPKEWIYDSS